MDSREIRIIANMEDGKEYTNELLASFTNSSEHMTNKALNNGYLLGLIFRYKREGVKGFVYTTKQRSLPLEVREHNR